MIRLGDILEKINEIEFKTLRKPTHVLIPREAESHLISQYNQLANSDADSVFQLGLRKYNILDVSSFLGSQIVLSTTLLNEFKILEEITTDS